MEQNLNQPLSRVVVLGANGGIGRHAVLLALKAGHRVTAILRTPGKLEINHPNLEIIQGDVLKAGTLDQHLQNKDVVISAIGKNSLKKTTLYSQGNRNLIDSMQRTGVKRGFFISAAGLEVNPTYSFLLRFLTRYVLQTMLCNMYSDLWAMEALIKASTINWTIMRPPKLTDGPETGTYRSDIGRYLFNGLKISRADVAHFIVHNLSNEAIVNKIVEVAY